MANITLNRLSTTISAADDAALEAAGSQLEPILNNYCISLDDTERSSLFSLDVENKVFVEECLNEARNHAEPLPPYVQADELDKDYTLFNQLDNIESQLNHLMQKVSDTKRLAGHEAYAMALMIYKLYEAATLAGVPDAKASYDRLKARFANQGSGSQPASEV